MEPNQYLVSGDFVDRDHPAVIDFAKRHVGDAPDNTGKAINLFYAVRDTIRYDPYRPFLDPRSYRASDTIHYDRGFCVAKSAVLAACARIHGIPARPGFADVRNHLATQRLLDLMGTDIFFWHSYTELYLDGRWVKCTPAFNKELCDRFGLKPLDFDGGTDSLFHEFDQAGQRHMEYIHDRGAFLDVPFDDIVETFTTHYSPELMEGAGGDF